MDIYSSNTSKTIKILNKGSLKQILKFCENFPTYIFCPLLIAVVTLHNGVQKIQHPTLLENFTNLFKIGHFRMFTDMVLFQSKVIKEVQ